MVLATDEADPYCRSESVARSRGETEMLRHARRARAMFLVLAIATTGLVAMSAGPAHADGPGAGTPWVVTLGDSAISGEAGRWAGNTNNSSSLVDAYGSSAYYDNAANTAETIPGCHRSKGAEAHIGGGVNSKNFACSGARTYTQT